MKQLLIAGAISWKPAGNLVRWDALIEQPVGLCSTGALLSRRESNSGTQAKSCPAFSQTVICTANIRAGDVVRWEAITSAGSGALQHKRAAVPHREQCKRAKSSPDFSQTPSAADTVEEIPLFSKHLNISYTDCMLQPAA